MPDAGTTGAPCPAVCGVVPCYNAGQRIRPVVEALLGVVGDVVVVDDGSTDESMASLAGLPFRAVSFPENRGKGYALLAGFREAQQNLETQCVAVLDADGQHDPRELPRLHRVFREMNADLVIGSRDFDSPGVPWSSRLGNKLTRSATRLLLGKDVPDTQSGYRLHSRRLLEDVTATLQGGRYETEMEILAFAMARGYAIVPATIATIYEEGNPSSHFHRVRDSYRVWRALFRATRRFRA